MLEKKAFELGEPKVASAKQVINLGVCRFFIITLLPIYYLIWPFGHDNNLIEGFCAMSQELAEMIFQSAL